MRELADISLFMKNCGQSGGSDSNMAAFEPVAVHNNDAGVAMFFDELFAKEPRCSAVLDRLCDVVLETRYGNGYEVNEGLVESLGTELGDALTRAYIDEMYTVTYPLYKAYWSKDRFGRAVDRNKPLGDRQRDKPLNSSKMEPCLELKDEENFKQALINYLPTVIAEMTGEDHLDQDMCDLCDAVGAVAGAGLSAGLAEAGEIGDLAFEKQSEFAATQTDPDKSKRIQLHEWAQGEDPLNGPILGNLSKRILGTDGLRQKFGTDEALDQAARKVDWLKELAYNATHGEFPTSRGDERAAAGILGTGWGHLRGGRSGSRPDGRRDINIADL